jgi:hypothetical protein
LDENKNQHSCFINPVIDHQHPQRALLRSFFIGIPQSGFWFSLPRHSTSDIYEGASPKQTRQHPQFHIAVIEKDAGKYRQGSGYCLQCVFKIRRGVLPALNYHCLRGPANQIPYRISCLIEKGNSLLNLNSIDHIFILIVLQQLVNRALAATSMSFERLIEVDADHMKICNVVSGTQIFDEVVSLIRLAIERAQKSVLEKREGL